MAEPQGMGPLCEREQERECILTALAAARRGQGTILFLRGDPGMGKSRLLAFAAEQAHTDFTVVTALGQEPEQAYPFALLHQVVESLVRRPETHAAALTQGLDVLRAWFSGRASAPQDGVQSGPGARAALLYAAYWLLASVAERRPLLLCLDDLHWTDPDSLEALRFVCRRLSALPLAVVAGLRAWPANASTLAEALAHDGGAQIRDLRALSPGGVAALLASEMGTPPGARRREQAVELTGGNPFLVQQLGRVWAAAPEDAPAGPGVALRHWPLHRRLQGVPPQGRRLLEAASVLGRTFRLEVAEGLAGLQRADEQVALIPLRDLGLVVSEPPGRWSFAHPLFQQAIYAELPDAERQRLHREALGALRALGVPAVELTPHVLQACRPGDRQALRDLLQAAAAAEARAAHDSVVYHLEAALGLCPQGDAQRAALLHRLGCAHQQAGEQGLAVAAFTAGLGEPVSEPALRAGMHIGCALSSAFVGDAAGARRHLADAVVDAARHSPARAAGVGVIQVMLLLSFGGWREAAAALEPARRFADQSGDARARAQVKACQAWLGWATGDALAYRWAREAAADFPLGPPDELEMSMGMSVSVVHGVTAMLWERYEEARGPLLEASARARSRGSTPALIWSATFLTDLAWRCGRLREAFAHAAAIPAEDIGLPWLTAEPRIHRGRVLMDMGELEGAAACFAQSAAEARATGQVPVQMLATFAQATLAARQDQWGAALAGFQAAWQLASAIEHTGADPFRWRQEAVDVLLHAGLVDQAAALLAEMEAATLRLDWPGAMAIVLRYRAQIAAAQSREAEAEKHFQAGLALHAQAGEALEQGRTLLAHGRWLRRRGERVRARGVLGDAAALLATCGAGYWVGQAEAERRAAGGRRRRDLSSGPLAGLTPQEYRVAELVSLGHTNREIACTLLISPKTLESHLGHIYQKLDLRSRQALRARFAELTTGGSSAGPDGPTGAGARGTL